jgi:hypothetical protein
MNLYGSFVKTKFNWLKLRSGAGYSVPDDRRSVAVYVGEYRETEKRQLFSDPGLYLKELYCIVKCNAFGDFLTLHHSIGLFHLPTLMYNYFIH